MKMKLASNNRDLTAALKAVQMTEKKKLQMNLDANLHRTFKSRCATLDVDMTTVVGKLIQDWLAEQSSK